MCVNGIVVGDDGDDEEADGDDDDRASDGMGWHRMQWLDIEN